MNCHEVAEVEDNYLLGDLKGEEMKEIERHLKACVSCAKRLSGYEEVLGMMFGALKPVAPAAHLRKAVLSQVAELPQEPVRLDSRRKPFNKILGGFGRILSPVAAMLVIGLTISTVFLSLQLQQTNAKQAEMQQILDVASSPTTLVWDLTEPNVPFNPIAPHARMYARPGSNFYLITATRLQPAPPGQVYRAWYTEDQTTDYMGDLQPDQNGNVFLKVTGRDNNAGSITGCFITKEQVGSLPTQPTGAQLLVWKRF